MYDVLIKGGKVLDGTKRKRFSADIGIKEGRIARIGELKNAKGKTEINARGKIVAPGFIDVQNRSDVYWQLFLEPNLPSLLFQGITSAIVGNCGVSIAPLTSGRVIESIQKYTDLTRVNVDWLSMAQFREKMESLRLGVNIGTMTGNGTLRRGVIGDEMRPLSETEIKTVEMLLEQSLEEGSFGFSAGLAFSHERASLPAELADLCRIVKKHDGVFSVHLRNETKKILKSLDEAIEIAQESFVNLEISHLKVAEEENWWLQDEVLEKITKARSFGIDVNFDVYPYTTTASVLYIFLPEWATDGGKKMLLKRLRDPREKLRIIRELEEDEHHDYRNAIISSSPVMKKMAGKRIEDIARDQEASVAQTIVNLLLASDGRVTMFFKSLSEENTENLDNIETKSNTLYIQHLWDIFHKNGQALRDDYALITKNRQTAGISSTNKLINPENIFVEEEALIECSILNGSTGPIYIGKHAEIMEGSAIRGPFALCDHSTLKMNAKIYGPTTIGPYSKVGGEINNSVIIGYSNKAHDGFIGNSVIGEWCNIGADTNNSNLKNNYDIVKLWNYPLRKFVDTGLQFCGLIMGDYSKCGINTMFNTGTVVGVNSNIFGAGFQRNFIPSFSWGGVSGFTDFDLETAIEIAERVCSRRDVIFSEVDRNILKHIFLLTVEYRKRK